MTSPVVASSSMSGRLTLRVIKHYQRPQLGLECYYTSEVTLQQYLFACLKALVLPAQNLIGQRNNLIAIYFRTGHVPVCLWPIRAQGHRVKYCEVLI